MAFADNLSAGSFSYQNVPVKTVFLGYGNSTVSENTVNRMKEIIVTSGKNLYIRKWAERILQEASVPPRDSMGEVAAIYYFVRDHFRYTHDLRDAEFIQTPPYVLSQLESGKIPMLDCDDFTIVGLSLLRSIGYNTKIRIAGYRPDKKFTHVYGMVAVKGQWIPFDAIIKSKPFGWEGDGATIKKDIMF
jgi:hypothetical protein